MTPSGSGVTHALGIDSSIKQYISSISLDDRIYNVLDTNFTQGYIFTNTLGLNVIDFYTSSLIITYYDTETNTYISDNLVDNDYGGSIEDEIIFDFKNHKIYIGDRDASNSIYLSSNGNIKLVDIMDNITLVYCY